MERIMGNDESKKNHESKNKSLDSGSTYDHYYGSNSSNNEAFGNANKDRYESATCRFRHENTVMYNPPPVSRDESTGYSVNSSDSFSVKMNSDSDFLQLQKDVITVQEFSKVNNNSTQQYEKLKNLQESSSYSDSTRKEMETSVLSAQFQRIQVDTAQNIVVSGFQTSNLYNNKSTDNKTMSHVHGSLTRLSDSSNNMISEDSISQNIDKESAEIAASSDFAKTNISSCLHEQKLQKSAMENGDCNNSACSVVHRELLETSFTERINIGRKIMSEIPLALNEICQNKLSKETENVIIDSFKDINNFVDCLLKLQIHYYTSSIVYEIQKLSQKLGNLILSFDNEMVEKGGTKMDFAKVMFSTSDARGQLFEQDAEQQCSLHCNFCKSSIIRYKDAKTHVNNKCTKSTENKFISEKNQNVEEKINILHSCDSIAEELRQEKQDVGIVENNFCHNISDISPPLQKVSKKDSVENCCHLDKKCSLNTQSNKSFEINENCVPQTSNLQNKTVAPVNYRFLMKSIARKSQSDIKSHNMYYVCLPCDFVTGQQKEWNIHFKNTTHINNTGCLNDIKDTGRLHVHYCLICRMCLYGDSSTIIEHNKLPEHSQKVINICMECQKYKCTSSKSNDNVNNLRDVNKDMCFDSNMQYKFSSHERLLKILFDKKYTNVGPRGFYCKLCNNYAYYNESKELHCYTKKHQQKIHNNPQLCKQFYCDSCHIYLYGDDDILSEHNAIKYHILMDNTRVIQENYKSSLKYIPDTAVSSDVSDSSSCTHVKQNAKVNSKGNEVRTEEENISVFALPEILNKSKTKDQNDINSRTSHIKFGRELPHVLKNSRNMQNLLFYSDYKMNGYVCSPCAVSVQTEKEWNDHIKSKNHCEKFCRKENTKLKNPKLCEICKIVFICDDDVFERHISSVCHQEQLELNDKLKNTISHLDGNITANESENYDDKSEFEETETSSNPLDDYLLQNSEEEDNIEETDNLCEEDNVEETDNYSEEDNSDETFNLNEEDTTNVDYVEEIDTMDGFSSNVPYRLTDDFISDSQSASSVQSSRQKKCKKQTQREDKMKQKSTKKQKRKRVYRTREDKPKGLYIAGLKQGTTHTHIFHVFRNFGHVEYVDVKYGKRDAALIIYKKGSDVDKIVRDNEPLMVNGCKLKIVNTIEAEFLPCYEEDHVLPDTVIKFLRSEGTVHKFIDGMLKTIEDSNTLEQHKAALLINDIKKLLPACSVHPFGSRVTGVATSTSDLDLYIDIGDRMYNGDNNQEPEQQAALIELISEHFVSSQAKVVFSDMQRITGARVPIIKLKHIPSGWNCDISCINGLSVENTKLISVYLKLDKRVKWLVMAVKTWATEVELADKTMFTTYALIWLVLFFLMQLKTPLICSVSDLRSKNGPSQFIAGWDCTFCHNPELIPPSRNTESCIRLLHNFFEFYATFPFRKYVMCPLIGKTLHRGTFNTISELPFQMKTYVTKVNNNPHVYTLQTNTSMCLQDPFDLSQNIVKRVRGPVFKKFVTFCKESAQLCEKWK